MTLVHDPVERLTAAVVFFLWSLAVYGFGREPLGADEVVEHARRSGVRRRRIALATLRFGFLTAAIGVLLAPTGVALSCGVILGILAALLTVDRPRAATAAHAGGRPGTASRAAPLEVLALLLVLAGLGVVLPALDLVPRPHALRAFGIQAVAGDDLATVASMRRVTLLAQALAIAAAFVAAARCGTLIVRGVLDRAGAVDSTAAPSDRTPTIEARDYRIGRVIGRLERWLLLLFVLVGSYAALGFLVAAKGLLRMREAEQDRRFAEYVVIGTLASILVAAGLGAVLRTIFGMGHT